MQIIGWEKLLCVKGDNLSASLEYQIKFTGDWSIIKNRTSHFRMWTKFFLNWFNYKWLSYRRSKVSWDSTEEIVPADEHRINDRVSVSHISKFYFLLNLSVKHVCPTKIKIEFLKLKSFNIKMDSSHINRSSKTVI